MCLNRICNMEHRQKQNKDNNKKNIHDIKNEKKPFNKKKYRQQKYSNKFKVNQWEEKRKTSIIRGFLKDLKREEKETKLNFLKKTNANNESNDINNENKKSKFNLLSIRQELLKKKQQKKEEILRIKQEREEALRKYKEKKMRAYKELSKKTRKGQPVMKGRMELLLEKIQQNT